MSECAFQRSARGPSSTRPSPSTPHSCAGTAFDVLAGEQTGAAAAFRPDDPDLADYVILEFAAFEWHEEGEPVVSHPHDPFGRIDVLRSSRHVRIEPGGRLLAESSRPMLLFETLLPVRFYLPREDVAVPLEALGAPPARRAGGRHGDLLRIQRPGVLLLRARRSARCGADVSRAAARCRTRV
jgi:Domain of unknown function (DUF427)